MVVYAHLKPLIREQPAAWHFWRISEAFFETQKRT
jgi:hypothetical protein